MSRRLDWGSIGGLTDFSDTLKQKGRHFCRPILLESTQLEKVSISADVPARCAS
jgi:hypothetical protein